MTAPITYRDLYRRATGQEREPYPYQERLASGPDLPAVLHAPTGAGKTLAVLCAWLHRRLYAAEPAVRAATPLRLVYALPMRVLVEQVWGVVNDALDGLGLSDEMVGRHLLMGGVAPRDWLRHPERPAVLVGTVDMLLSRALNRGYAAGRHRWPMEFGLLHADCLWVLDETQLMGVATITAAQLDGLRERLGTWRRCRTIWMSATIEPTTLATVDHPRVGDVFTLGPEDVAGELGRRLRAPKLLERRDGDAAAVVLAEHAPGSLTLVVHNTVRAAMETHRRLGRRRPAGEPELLLLHSRFRPPDRRRLAASLTEAMPPGGRVICATQVVEAGVDISARLLVTELAPWSSVVQRLGRCNRYGELPGPGLVHWLEPGRPEPYREDDLGLARSVLAGLEGGDVSAWALSRMEVAEPPAAVAQVLRRRDLVDLFDTAPDLSGNDLDVSRFIRDVEDIDCRVYWRRWDDEKPPPELYAPLADELCPVPAGELRKLVESGRPAFAWDAVEARWQPLGSRDVRPGRVVLLPAAAGGYTPETGWDPSSKRPVEPLPAPERPEQSEANRGDPLTATGAWLDLAAHTRDVEAHAAAIAAAAIDGAAPAEAFEAVRLAARVHDVGKALPRFQEALLESCVDEAERAMRQGTLWAKSARYVRPAKRNPRHELASALALLQSGWLAGRLAEPWAGVALFLVAGHHGRARVTIRPWPDEQDEEGHPVLGVHQDEPLPEVGVDGLRLPAMRLRLEPLRMGDGAAGASWATRMLGLRDHPDLGPFRLAHLEALLRAADWRASAEEEVPAASAPPTPPHPAGGEGDHQS